jgi:hypothetical protein
LIQNRNPSHPGSLPVSGHHGVCSPRNPGIGKRWPVRTVSDASIRPPSDSGQKCNRSAKMRKGEMGGRDLVGCTSRFRQLRANADVRPLQTRAVAVFRTARALPTNIPPFSTTITVGRRFASMIGTGEIRSPVRDVLRVAHRLQILRSKRTWQELGKSNLDDPLSVADGENVSIRTEFVDHLPAGTAGGSR